jgi:hypothetical protein
MHVAVTTIVGGRASINARGGADSRAVGRASFCRLIRASADHHCWHRALSDPSLECLSNIFGISEEPPIAGNSADVNVDLITEV